MDYSITTKYTPMSILQKQASGMAPFRHLLSDLFDNDNFFDEKFWKRQWVPAVNVSESDKEYQIEFAVPGMQKEDFKIKVEKGILTVSAERKNEKEETEKNFTRREYSYNSFTRSFSIPDDAREEDVQALYENGILKLMVAKKAPAPSNAREITVR